MMVMGDLSSIVPSPRSVSADSSKAAPSSSKQPRFDDVLASPQQNKSTPPRTSDQDKPKETTAEQSKEDKNKDVDGKGSVDADAEAAKETADNANLANVNGFFHQLAAAQQAGQTGAEDASVEDQDTTVSLGKDKKSGKTADKADGKSSDRLAKAGADLKTGSIVSTESETELGTGILAEGQTDEDGSAEAALGDKQPHETKKTGGESIANRLDVSPEKAQPLKTIQIGDKLAMHDAGPETKAAGRIADIEVTQNKQVGDMRVLHIKLNPDDLGAVDARLRMTNNGLHIELHAERQETARLLAGDHQMLSKALEKSGFNDDGRLSIAIIDKSPQAVQQAQASNSGQGAGQDNSGQNFNGQRQSFGQNGQGGQNGSRQNFEQFPFTDTPVQDVSPVERTVYRDPRRLVV